MQVQKAQRFPVKMNPKRLIPRHITIKMKKVKDIKSLKGSKGEQIVTHKGALIRLSADFSTKTTSQKGIAQNIQSNKRPATKTTLSNKVLIQN